MTWLLWKLTPWRWLLRRDNGLRERFAAWVYGRMWMQGEREIAPLFWWVFENTVFKELR